MGLKNKIIWGITITLGIIFILVVTLFFIRMFSERQLDDVNPKIPCSEELLEKADVLFVIPVFENKSIANNREWCDRILKLNKKIEMHGVYHSYREFLTDRDFGYLNMGISEFEKCFGFAPSGFKAPQLAISENNKNLMSGKMKLYSALNQIFHKVYHCNDSGKFPNRVIDAF